MTPLLVPLVFSLAFTTHFPLTRGTPTFAVSSVIYAVNRGTLYRSDDGGATFAARSNVMGTYVAIDPTNAEIVYDVGGQRRSDDGGATWTPFGSGGFGGKIVIHPANPAEIRLFGNCSSSHPQYAGVFVSHDRGRTWQQETSECTFDIAFDPLPPYAEYRAGIFGSGASLPARQVVADARTPQVHYGLSSFQRDVVLFSDDGGATWRAFGPSPPVGNGVNVLALDGAHARLFAGTTGGLLVSANDVPWWQFVPMAPVGPVHGITIAGDLLYVATANGLYRAPLATLDPFTPAAALPAVPTSVRGIAGDPHASRLYATADVVDAATGVTLGSVWRSDDAGEHWAPISGGIPIPLSYAAIAVDGAGDVYAFDDVDNGTSPVTGLFHYDAAAGKSDLITANITLPLPRSLWADPHHHGVLCTVKNALLYASIDGGHAWTLVSSLNDGTKWIAIGSVSFDPSRSGVLYASTDAGIFRSLDGGATWSLFDALANAVITVAPSRSATLYRAGLGLARSDDGGATWTQLAMPSGIVTVDPFSDRSVWVFSDRNLYHSADGGATWALEASFAATITAVVIDRDGTHIHVALNPDVPPSELDATIRSERRRSMLSP